MAGRRRLVEAEIRVALADLEYEPADDPVEVLRRVCGKAERVADWYLAWSAGIDDPALVTAGLRECREWTDRAARAAGLLGQHELASGKLELDERTVRVGEVRAALVVSELRAVLEGEGLPEDRVTRVLGALGERFARRAEPVEA